MRIQGAWPFFTVCSLPNSDFTAEAIHFNVGKGWSGPSPTRRPVGAHL